MKLRKLKNQMSKNEIIVIPESDGGSGGIQDNATPCRNLIYQIQTETVENFITCPSKCNI